ncbi:hypothetical protein HMPREF0578_1646 [Mobiluncus mulieris 28-1]|nr:hypothetical protein HMPREF0578_1646 [Mobiluncus mulieris 28-1]
MGYATAFEVARELPLPLGLSLGARGTPSTRIRSISVAGTMTRHPSFTVLIHRLYCQSCIVRYATPSIAAVSLSE